MAPMDRQIVVGIGQSGLPFVEKKLPSNVKLLSIPPTLPLPDGVEDIEFLISGGPEMRAVLGELTKRMSKLKVIQTLSAGVDVYIPLLPLLPGVLLCNAGGVHDIAVSEWCVAVILASLRQLGQFWDLQHKGIWTRATKQVTEGVTPDVGMLDDLEDKTVLILGYGSIGKALGKRLEPFGTHIVGVARSPSEGVHSMAELDVLLPEADIVVLLLPLTDETRKVVDAGFIENMKPGALLVNAGRGPLVDTDALISALHKGRIRAALDVTDPEPLTEGHPLWSAPNLVLTPHVGGSVARMRVRGYKLALDQLGRYVRGEPLLNIRSNGY